MFYHLSRRTPPQPPETTSTAVPSTAKGTPADCTSLRISKARTSLILAWRSVDGRSKKRPLVALLAPMEGPQPLLAPMEGPKQRKYWNDEMIKVLLDKCIEEMKSTGRNGTSLHRQSWARLGKAFKEKFNIDFNQKDIKNGFDNLKAKYFGASASVSGPSASGPSASGASAIRERVGALNMDDDPLVDVAVDVDDDDDRNSRAHKIHDEVRPKKKAKTSRVTMDDLMVDMQCALKDMVKTTDGPTTEEYARGVDDIAFRTGRLEGVDRDDILSEAIRNQNAPFPLPSPEKYYICDAAYAHTRGFMAPYRNVRYWLGDSWRRGALSSKEKFNHSHAKLRNVIERAYSVLKARFPILTRMTPFSLTTQRNITIACFALYNFIRKEGLDDELFATYDQSNVQLDNENVLVEDDGGIEEDRVQPQGNAFDRQYMSDLRDQIAQRLMRSG
nr:putative harbinger transposase-derived nuclease domain-containing protein [Tanacetum cinerariifolium]